MNKEIQTTDPAQAKPTEPCPYCGLRHLMFYTCAFDPTYEKTTEEQPSSSQRRKMPDTSKATPRPWAVGWKADTCTIENDDQYICYMASDENDTGEDNAKLIVTAVNAFDDLVAALLGVLRVADRKTVEFDAARAALKKAGIRKENDNG